MYNQTNNVNIKPKSYLPEFHVSQNDVGRTLTAHLVSDDGDVTIPAGATVTMAGTKPSGLGYTVTGTIDGSDVSFNTDAVMTDEPGRIVSEIRIVQGDTVIGTTNVVLSVEPNPHPDDTTDGRREPLVNEITALLEQITEQADRVEEYSGKVLNMTVTAHESDEVTVTKTEGEAINLDFGLPRGQQGIQGVPGRDGADGVTPDFSIGAVETLAPGEQATATITGTEEDPVLNLSIPQGAKGDKGDPGEVSLETLAKVMVSDTASGTIASFTDGSDVLPAKSVLVTLNPKQSGTGTPSPSNIRPISGWDEVEVVVSPTQSADDGTTYQTTLPQTVYGGTLDVVSGVLTVDRAIVDLGTLNWYYTASNDFFYTGSGTLSDRKAGSTNFICSSYNNIGNVYDNGMKTAGTGSIAGGFGSTQIKVKDTRYTDAASFKTAMSGVQLVYELATPTTIQCDPQAVQTLIGDNNVCGGDAVVVDYYADTKLYIEKMLGATLPTAPHHHTGRYRRYHRQSGHHRSAREHLADVGKGYRGGGGHGNLIAHHGGHGRRGLR